MTLDEELLALVRQSAKGFCERHRAEFAAVETLRSVEFPGTLLEEAAQLGWLSSLTGNAESSRADDDAWLLAALVQEVAYCSPALATRLLVHHYCRACFGTAEPLGTTAGVSDSAWFALEATTGDGRCAPGLAVQTAASTRSLSGTMRFVVGGDQASLWLGLAEHGQDALALIAVERMRAQLLTPVATLGLRGLGVTSGTMSDVGSADFQIIVSGPRTAEVVALAYRFISPGLLGIALALLEQTQRLATEHARTRRQNGTTLDAIPAVRQKLDEIASTMALVRVTQAAWHGPAADAALLLDQVSRRVLEATDAGLQVLGGAGYIVGHGLERLWRDMRQLKVLVPRFNW